MNNISSQIYISDISALFDEEIYQKAAMKATNERRAKAAGYRQKGDRARCIAAELLLKYVLQRCGTELRPGMTEISEYGKPYLRDMPWLKFNLSHSGVLVMCAVSSGEVGCDVEKKGEMKLNVAKRFFHPEEYAMLCTAEEENAADLFYRIWTLKESFIKAAGQGLKLPLDRFCVIPGEAQGIRQDFEDKTYLCKEYMDITGYGAAICGTAEDIPQAQLINVPLSELI